jgi:hypothetical protein
MCKQRDSAETEGACNKIMIMIGIPLNKKGVCKDYVVTYSQRV